MKWYLFVMGLVWIMSGTLMLLATGVFREHYVANLKVRDHRVFSPLAIAAGILFLLAASSSSQATFIVILGLLSLAKGLLLLFGPREKIKRMIDWWFEASDQVYRGWGILALGLGIAVLVTIVG
jgi:uncharacterized protein YjeT (DUF2065 family)